MDNTTEKPMKKAHRNIFHKVGKKLEQFEQSIGLPSANLHRDSASSVNEVPDSYYHRNSDSSNEQDDTVSLSQLSQQNSSDSKRKFGQKHGQLHRPHSSTGLNDAFSNVQWYPNVEENHEPIVKDSSTQYDKEMEIICKELMETNNTIRLHECRDYDKKVSLLRMAVSFNTATVTGPVILFLENTLSKPLFYELIKQHPSAVKNYINLAKLLLGDDHYIAMLKQFDKNEAVAIIRLRQASKMTDMNRKIALLDQIEIDLVSNYWWHLQVAEYRHLLHKQRELQTSFNTPLDNRTALETYKIVFDSEFRRQKQARDTHTSTTNRSKELQTAFHMSPEMIMCGKLSVIMQCGLRMHYEDFLHQTTHQTMFGKKYIIAPEYLADMVYNWVRLSGEGQLKASEKAEKFLNQIHDPRRRIYYAEKFQNYDVAMDTIVNVLRDRIQLENLRKRIPPDHPSLNRATSLLENTKWKN